MKYEKVCTRCGVKKNIKKHFYLICETGRKPRRKTICKQCEYEMEKERSFQKRLKAYKEKYYVK